MKALRASRFGARELSLGIHLICGFWLVSCQSPNTDSGTASQAEGSLVLDLTATLPAADISVETARLEMGRPATRARLISGWGQDEQDAAGPFVWSLGSQSILEFFAVTPTDLELGLYCQALDYAGAEEQRVKVALNQQPVGEVTVQRGLRRYQLAVPAARLVSGSNRLSFSFSSHHRPVDVIPGAADPRELAVKWREITLGGLNPSEMPRISAEATEHLEIPTGAATVYYFDFDAPGELVIEALSAWGSQSEDLELVATYTTAEGHSERRRFDPKAAKESTRWQLDAAEGTIASLSLATASHHRKTGPIAWLRTRLSRDRPSGLTLVQPTIRSLSSPPAIDSPTAPVRRPPVIIYLIDTLRADHLGTYGYSRPTSPHIDRLAQDATVFLDAQAPSSWTRPVVASLLTGLSPRRHGVTGRGDPLSRELETLAEILAATGYDTAGFVTNGNVAPAFAFDQGFAVYRYLRESGETRERHQLSDVLGAWAVDWLDRRGSESRPFFLYLHATDPHAPYVPPEPFRSRFASTVDPELGWLANVREVFSDQQPADEALRRGLIDLYDAEIAFNDEHFGRLLERLRQLDLYDQSLILLVSDHGEEFLDHDHWEHGRTLYSEQLHVPLILKLPGGAEAGTRIAGAASHADVLPTVLDLLGIPLPKDLDGTSLLPAARRPNRPTFAHLALANRDMKSVTARGLKLIFDRSPSPRGEPVELYDLAADRNETRDLATLRPFERAYLRQVLARREIELSRGTDATTGDIEIPEELRRQLEALGYL